MSFFRELLGYLSQVIIFKDAKVKHCLLASSDINPDGSGDITYAEARGNSVDFDTIQAAIDPNEEGNASITSFNELPYFRVGSIPDDFLKDCTSLAEVKFPVIEKWGSLDIPNDVIVGNNLLDNTVIESLDLRGTTHIVCDNVAPKFGYLGALKEIWINNLVSIKGKIFLVEKVPNIEKIIIGSEAQWCEMQVDTSQAGGGLNSFCVRPNAGGKASLYKGDNTHLIRRFEIPATVQTCTAYAFAGIKNLDYIVIQNDLACGDKCFKDLPNTTKIIGMEYVTSFGASCFEDCKAEGIVFPSSLVSVGDNTFKGSSVATLSSTKLKTINKSAFSGSSLTAIYIRLDDSSEVVTIGGINETEGAFRNCTSLGSVYIEKINTIAAFAFYKCTALYGCYFVGLTTIGWASFADCTRLRTFDAPDLTTVGDSAFKGDTLLEENASNFKVSELTSIGTEAFMNCTSLNCPSVFPNLTSIGAGAFSGCIAPNSNEVTLSKNDGIVGFVKGNNVQEYIAYASPFPSSVTTIRVPSGLISSYEGDTNGWAKVLDNKPSLSFAAIS